MDRRGIRVLLPFLLAFLGLNLFRASSVTKVFFRIYIFHINLTTEGLFTLPGSFSTDPQLLLLSVHVEDKTSVPGLLLFGWPHFVQTL
jgi:hypothetical protein